MKFDEETARRMKAELKTQNNPRPLHQIAAEIRREWNPPYYAAVPYLEAMSDLDSIDDMYMYDSARDIVLRFLGNARTWKGATARRVKAELKALLK